MRRRSIFVELTPLLDVILILLFVTLMRSGQQVEASRTQREAAQAENAALTAQLAQTQEALSALQREERSLSVVERESMVLTLSVQESGARRYLIESEYADRIFITLDSARADSVAERLHDALRNAILSSGRESAYLVFQYDRNTIYHREYALAAEVVQQLKPELLREGIYLSVVELDHQEGE